MLWKTDGTPAGTSQVAPVSLQDRRPSSREAFSSGRRGRQRPGAVEDGRHGRRHGPGQGHPAGLAELAPRVVTPARRTAFFSAVTNAAGRELWATDGTAAGTPRLKDVLPGAARASSQLRRGPPAACCRHDRRLRGRRRRARRGALGERRHRRRHAPGADSSPARRLRDRDWLTAAGGALFFVADDGVHGRELWATDGTPPAPAWWRIRPGPRLVADPATSAVVRPRSLFSADDGVHGREPWRSDGSAGRHLAVQDIAPGALPFQPARVHRRRAPTSSSRPTTTRPASSSGRRRRATVLTTFSDVPPTFWAWRSIEALATAGITTAARRPAILPGPHGDPGRDGGLPRPRPPRRRLRAAAGHRHPLQRRPGRLLGGRLDRADRRRRHHRGCAASPPRFCPASLVTRAEMADLPAARPPRRGLHAAAGHRHPSSPTCRPVSGPRPGSSSSPPRGSPTAAAARSTLPRRDRRPGRR